jgi:predicted aminopeptidase
MNTRLPPGLRVMVAGVFLAALSGCAQLGYYWQSIHGHMDLRSREKPIPDVIGDPASPPALRDKLAFALKAREFASEELGLPRNDSYRRYADLGRPYVVWNVFAAPEFSVQPVQWCFVMAGCVHYRGYFSRAQADAFATVAAGHNAQKHDVHIGGVPAYSTLGWFADPVLNTFVHYPVVELARIIFHELSHQVVYVKDDSIFNESFAVAVEREGLRRWLARYGSDEDRRTFERMRGYRADFLALIQAYRIKLETLYQQRIAPEAMRVTKQRLFDGMQSDYRKLKDAWGGFAGYDRWFAQKPNNALLASVAIYTQHVPAFESMLREHGNDLPAFYAAVKALAQLDKATRESALRRYTGEATAVDTL